ncbi:MAG TPA: hypothetical protein VGG35_13020 [Streptosporangiaceae bacterium]
MVYAEVPSGVVRLRRERLGVTAGDFPGWPGPLLHILTAHNPSGVVRAAAGNAAAEASPEAGLTRRGLRWFRAAGGDAA